LNLLLASNSPRRKQLLEEAGYSFETGAQSIDEDYPEDIPIEKVAEFLAVKKNDVHAKLFPDYTILTADTTVILNNELLEKPSDLDHAKEMLLKLSGQVHQVISGVCVSNKALQEKHSFSVTTEVHFKELDISEVDYYVEKFLPLDKAGAYGIQEWIGMVGIKKIEGSYYNVVGLPLLELYQLLKNTYQIIPH
jgi:septum formation protein